MISALVPKLSAKDAVVNQRGTVGTISIRQVIISMSDSTIFLLTMSYYLAKPGAQQLL